jgi:hypothetical protein
VNIGFKTMASESLKNIGQKLLWAGLFVYLVLLIRGVIAEIFDIEPILDWWIWRPPGKY